MTIGFRLEHNRMINQNFLLRIREYAKVDSAAKVPSRPSRFHFLFVPPVLQRGIVDATIH
jgi:hypothetical protein